MAELLRRLGCTVDYDAVAGVVEIDVPEQIGHRADYDLVRRAARLDRGAGPARRPRRRGRRRASRAATRSARAGWTCTPPASRRWAPGCTSPTASSSPRRRAGCDGAEIRLEFPSVGATENVLTAAVLARGTTVSRTPPVSRRSSTSPRCSSRWVPGSAAPAPRSSRSRASPRCCARPSTPSSRTGSPPAPGPSPRRPRAATSRCRSQAGAPLSALELVRASGCRRRRHGPRVPGRLRWPPTAGVRRRDAALPGLPDRPPAVRARLQRGGRGLGHDHREPLRGALPHRPGAQPPRCRDPHRRPPRHGARRRAPVRRAGRGQRHPGRCRAGHRRAGRRRESPP